MLFRNVKYKRRLDTNPWRKIAINSWTQPEYATIYSKVELDPTPAAEFIKKYNRENEDKITMTHFVAKVCGILLERHSYLNATIRGSKAYLREDCDVFVHMSKIDMIGREDLSGSALRNANKMSLADISYSLSQNSKVIKKGNDLTFKKIKFIFKYTPSFVIRSCINLVSFLQNRLNIWSPLFGTNKNTFGSLMLTNVGTFGVKEAFVPFAKYTYIHAICSMGKVTKEPVYRDGELKVGNVIRFCWTLDHRLVDGSSAGKMLETFQKYYENPSLVKDYL